MTEKELEERRIQELKRDMRVVADHYGCTAEERREMWACAMEHLEDAMVCFRSLAWPLYEGVKGNEMVIERKGAA